MSKKSISYGLIAAGFLLFSQSGLGMISDTQPNDKKQFMVMEGIKDQKKDLTEYDFKKLSENIKKVADDCLKAATITDDTMFLKERDNCAISIQQASGAIRMLDTKLEKIRSDVDAIGYLKLVSDDAPNVIAPKTQSSSTSTPAVDNSNANPRDNSSNGAQNISVSNFPDQKQSSNTGTDSQAPNSIPPSESSPSSSSTGSSDGMIPPVSDPSLGSAGGSSAPSDPSTNPGGSAVGGDPAVSSTDSSLPSNP